MTETFKKEIVQRITRNLLDIQILRLIREQSMWGYKIKKQVETRSSITLRHSALYPLLNTLKMDGFLTSQEQRQGGRNRKVYTITPKGEEYVRAYEDVLREQIDRKDTK